MSTKLPHVLIVDDQIENRALLEVYLDELPIKVEEAESGQEALEKLQRQEYAMVLLDVQMPEMDGFQVLESMRKNEKMADIPVIFVSAISNSEEHIIRGIEGGAVDFLPKPVNGTILTSKVRNFIALFEKQKKLDQLVQKLERTNQRLKENERKFKRITQSASDGVILLNPNKEIRFWNTASSRIFGYNKFELAGESFSELLLAEKSRAALDAHYEALHKSQNSILNPIRLTAIKQNGVQFPIELSLGLFQTADNETNYTMIVRDMTQRDKMEKEAQEARELREANKVIKEFMDNVSHELRTPMNAIIGISNMLLKYNSDNLADKQKEGLNIINQSGGRLLDMINDVLDISRIESNKVEVQSEAFNLDQLLATLKSIVLSLLEGKNIKFFIRKSNTVPDSIISDSKKLQQILINLLSNAVKFTPEGKIQLYMHYKDGQLHVEVEDSGIGIEQEDLSKIFQRFQQIDNTASKEYKGTGLGLNIVSKLIELMDGEIEVESQVGRGTTMRFHIPVGNSTAGKERDCSEKKSYSKQISWVNLEDTHKKLALIIDSDRNNQFLFTNLLREANFRIVSSCDAYYGLQTVEEIRPDFLILNMEMPKIHGVSFLNKLKEKQEFSELPILAFTSFQDLHIDPRGLNIRLHKGVLKETGLLSLIQSFDIQSYEKKPCKNLCFYEDQNHLKELSPKNAEVFKNESYETALVAFRRRKVERLVLDGFSEEGSNRQLLLELTQFRKLPELVLVSDINEGSLPEVIKTLNYHLIKTHEIKHGETFESVLCPICPNDLNHE